MGDEGVDQRAVGISGAWVDHEARRLVQHDDLFILEQDFQVDVLAHRVRRDRVGDDYGKNLTAFHLGRGLGDRLAVARYEPGFDERLQPAARQLRRQAGERAVDALAGQRGRNDDGHEGIGHRRLRLRPEG
jgi:hypothetical protein